MSKKALTKQQLFEQDKVLVFSTKVKEPLLSNEEKCFVQLSDYKYLKNEYNKLIDEIADLNYGGPIHQMGA